MRVSIAVADNMTDAGIAIALDVLRTANAVCRNLRRKEPFAITVCSPRGRPVRTAAALRVTGLSSFAVAARAQVLLVPGTWIERDEDVPAHLASPGFAELVALVARVYRRGGSVMGSCSGVFALGMAGVLDDQVATTSWWLAPSFARACPRVALDPSRALVPLRRLATAGAVFAMADLALHLVRTTVGPQVADVVTRYLLLDEHPAQAPYMALTQLAAGDELLVRAERWIRAHLTGPISLRTLARAIGASERTLARRVAASLATTPAHWVRRIRAEEAARLLETTAVPIERVAERVGFGSSLSLRRALRGHAGVTPRELRQRARQAGGDPPGRRPRAK
ncbi:MAG: helix-turn-helix domain-containing protein [Myxococcales bacterium]|nr:helix-turn-helix domain-containing protein [Myxococcales bacterium]